MLLSYRYILGFIALIGAIFFPYMPIVHADSDSGSLAPCMEMHRAAQDTEHHSMLLCIQIIQETLIGHGVVWLSNVTHTITPIWKVQELPFETQKFLVSYHLHALDPPCFIGKDLVGIIKLTT